MKKETNPVRLARMCAARMGLRMYSRSVAKIDGGCAFLARREIPGSSKLLIVVDALKLFRDIRPIEAVQVEGHSVRILARTEAAAAALRKQLPRLVPTNVDRKASFGFGDRLGMAGAAHLRVAREFKLIPVLAQQSVRELARTNRTPQDVMDAALWAAFEDGWTAPFGSDADHIKTTDDLDRYLAAGFTLFTFDVGDGVQDAAAAERAGVLCERFKALPWRALAVSADDLCRFYLGRTFSFEKTKIRFTEKTLLRAAVKYGCGVAEAVRMARHLERKAGKRAASIELSVDETDAPTSPEEHFFVARELRRLDVKLASLAPRFPGAFEKAVDFKGSLAALRRSFQAHAAIARRLGNYKLSLHSGSDKFRTYGMLAEATRGFFHVKTAGTSYLEALRAVAGSDPEFFRELTAFAIKRFPEDRASYALSARLEKVRLPREDDELPGLLNQDDARQVFHCTFGSVLTARDGGGEYIFRKRLLSLLDRIEADHYAAVASHLRRHLALL